MLLYLLYLNNLIPNIANESQITNAFQIRHETLKGESYYESMT